MAYFRAYYAFGTVLSMLMVVLGLILPKAPRKTSKKTASDNNHPEAEITQESPTLKKVHIEHAKEMQIKKKA